MPIETILHQLMDFTRFVHVQLGPHRNAVELQMSYEVRGSAVLDFVQEKGVLRWIPVCVLVVHLAV